MGEPIAEIDTESHHGMQALSAGVLRKCCPGRRERAAGQPIAIIGELTKTFQPC